MPIHTIPDTAAVIGEYAGEKKVGTEVSGQRKLEKDLTKLQGTQPVTRPTEKTSETKDLEVSLKFSVDEETGEHVIRVLDPETGDIIRQFPPEEFLQVAKNLHNLRGILVSTRL